MSWRGNKDEIEPGATANASLSISTCHHQLPHTEGRLWGSCLQMGWALITHLPHRKKLVFPPGPGGRSRPSGDGSAHGASRPREGGEDMAGTWRRPPPLRGGAGGQRLCRVVLLPSGGPSAVKSGPACHRIQQGAVGHVQFCHASEISLKPIRTPCTQCSVAASSLSPAEPS